MTMLEILEHDKEKLIAQLEEAKSPEKAASIISDEMDSLLLRYNKRSDSQSARDAAAYMLQTAKLSSALVNSIGDIQVWEKQISGQSTGTDLKDKIPGKMPLRSLLLLAGAVICAFTALFIATLANPSSYRWTDLLLALILGAASPVLAWFSGMVRGRQDASAFGARSVKTRHGNRDRDGLMASAVSYETRCSVDAQKIYICLHNVIFAIDQNLCFSTEKVQASDMPEEHPLPFASPFSEQELALFASLLEAGCSNDGSYALDQISDVRYFLHRNGIETIDYDGKNRDLFDVMPSPKMQTLRPALVMNGNLLKKGMAAGEYEGV